MSLVFSDRNIECATMSRTMVMKDLGGSRWLVQQKLDVKSILRAAKDGYRVQTGKITNQCHVMVDNWFQTVGATKSNPINFEHDDIRDMRVSNRLS